MIRIKDWNTAYWGYIRTASEPYPCHTKVNAFIGPSGGGKTTLMDAIRIALGDANFENNRTMDHYIHPLSNWAIVRVAFWNREEEGYPFAPSGYKNEVVTVCVRLDKSKGKSEREYYLFDSDFLNISELGQNPKLYKECHVQYNQYLQRLEDAGVTTVFRRLMIMRPEDIQNMVDLTPSNLFRKVFELKGQKEIQDKHEESLKKVNELIQQENLTNKELLVAEQKLVEYEEKKRLFMENEGRKDECDKLNKIYLKRCYWDKFNELHNQEEEQKKAEQEKLNRQEEYSKKKVALGLLEDELESENINFQNIQNLLGKVKDQESELNCKFTKIKTQYDTQSEQISKLEAIPEESISMLGELLKRSSNECFKINVQLDKFLTRKEELENKFKLLNSNKNDLPRWVEEFKEVLEQKNIPYILLADCINVNSDYEQWLNAIEAFLGRERYRIIVDDSVQLETKKLQEKYEYRARISLPKKSKKLVNTILLKGKYPTLRSALQIDQESSISEYLVYLNNIYLVNTVEEGHQLQKEGIITLTKKGLLQDGDGALFYKSYELVCGRFARERYRQQLEEEHKNLIINIKMVEKESDKKSEELQGFQTRFNNQNERKKISESKTICIKLEDDVRVAKSIWEEKHKEYNALFDKFQSAHQIINHLTEEVTRNKGELNTLSEKIQNTTNTINGYRGNITKCWKDLQLAKEELYKVGCKENQVNNLHIDVLEQKIFIRDDGIELTQDILEARIATLQNEINVFAIKYDDINAAIIAMVEPQISLVNQRKSEVEKVQREREDWQERLANSEYALKIHIKETMNQYIEEFSEMASLLGAKASGKFDQEGQHYLQWQLHIKIAFDGKEMRPYYDPSFSKGQRAAMSIMLLLAAVNNHREGAKNSIMFLDEPTSRVDDYRANEIGLILQETNIQYFITHQISASLQSVDWIDHAYIISKLRDGDKFADDPIFESRRVRFEENSSEV